MEFTCPHSSLVAKLTVGVDVMVNDGVFLCVSPEKGRAVPLSNMR